MPCLPLLYTLRRRKKGKGRSARKLSTPHLSSFQEPYESQAERRPKGALFAGCDLAAPCVEA